MIHPASSHQNICWNKITDVLLSQEMVKQFTALILVLAIANPFCCCFAETFQTSETKEAPPVRSCCHSSEPESNNSEDDAPTCPDGCPCDKSSQAQADDHDDFNKLVNITPVQLTLLEPASKFQELLIPAPVYTSRFSWIPPPSDIPIYLINCVSRI